MHWLSGHHGQVMVGYWAPPNAAAHDDEVVEKLNEEHTFYCSFRKSKN